MDPGNFVCVICNKHFKQAGWFLRPYCAPSCECPQFGMPSSYDRCTPLHRRLNQNIPPSVVLLQQCHCRNRHRGKLQNLSSPSVFCSNQVKFVFTIHETQTQQNGGSRILQFEFCDFWEFFEIFKRRRAVPLRPIWTIMVAAKLDQSRVVMTKFHQNRSTLKGRSVGQRQTDGQTRLKLMALQVCSRANRSQTQSWVHHLQGSS